LPATIKPDNLQTPRQSALIPIDANLSSRSSRYSRTRPLAEREQARKAPTVRDLWEDYEKIHLPVLAPRTQVDVRHAWTAYILPELGNTKVRALTSREVDTLHRSLSARHPTRANRVIAFLRSALNLAVRWSWIDKNPASGFRRNPELPRELYLTVEQIQELLACLERMPNKQAANVIRLLLLTGARRGEVLNADWSQFDLETGFWTKPSSHTKQRRTHRIPLSLEACQLLAAMKEESKGPLLFPTAEGNPIPDIKASWTWLRKELGMPQLRIHDLRHTFASLLVSDGEGLPVIGRMLGHTQQQTTLRYAHLFDDPLRRAAGKVGRVVSLKPSNSEAA